MRVCVQKQNDSLNWREHWIGQHLGKLSIQLAVEFGTDAVLQSLDTMKKHDFTFVALSFFSYCNF